MKVLLAHPGTQYSHQLARQLFSKDLLFEFHTGIAFGKDSWVFRLLSKFPEKIFKKVSNRFIDDVPDQFIKRHVCNEIIALIKIRCGQKEETVLFKRNAIFQKQIPIRAIKKSNAIIGFDTSSYILIDRCLKFNKKFYLDVSIGHPISKENIYKGLLKNYPEWIFSIKQKPAKQIALEQQEMERAHQIVVASHFTFLTYIEHGIPPNKISINPYGVDSNKFKPNIALKEKSGIIDFVFVGLVDARKGIPFLLQTWQKCSGKNFRITLIGPISESTASLINAQYPSVIIKGKLSFEQLVNILPDFDVMIFPSFFEGFGLVIPEAMACGLPVITTSATCGPDVITHGKEGFIIEPGNEMELKNAIEYFSDSENCLYMGNLARQKSMLLSWDMYGNRWEKILNSIN